MRKILTEEEKFRQMMEEPVQTLIPRLALPSMVSMIVVAVYNMADTFFVSQLGTSASGAVGIVYSMMAIIQAIAFMIGMGCGNEISRLLGAKKQEEAECFVAILYYLCNTSYLCAGFNKDNCSLCNKLCKICTSRNALYHGVSRDEQYASFSGKFLLFHAGNCYRRHPKYVLGSAFYLRL